MMGLLRKFNALIRSQSSYFRGRTEFAEKDGKFYITLPLTKLKNNEIGAIEELVPIELANFPNLQGIKAYLNLPQDAFVRNNVLWENIIHCIDMVRYNFRPGSYKMFLGVAIANNNELFPYKLCIYSEELKTFMYSNYWNPQKPSCNNVCHAIKEMDLSFNVIESKPTSISLSTKSLSATIHYEDGYKVEINNWGKFAMVCNPKGTMWTYKGDKEYVRNILRELFIAIKQDIKFPIIYDFIRVKDVENKKISLEKL